MASPRVLSSHYSRGKCAPIHMNNAILSKDNLNASRDSVVLLIRENVVSRRPSRKYQCQCKGDDCRKNSGNGTPMQAIKRPLIAHTIQGRDGGESDQKDTE